MPATRLSIANVVAIAVVLATTVTLTAFGYANYQNETGRRMARLHEDHQTWAQQLAAGLVLPLWNFDDEQIDRIIEGSMSDREISAVIVRLNDAARTVRGWERDQDWGVKLVADDRSVGTDWQVTRDIDYGGEVLGTVSVFVTPRFTEQGLAQTLRWTVLMVLVLDGILITCLYSLLWGLLIKPVRRLQAHAGEVTAELVPASALPMPAGNEIEGLRRSIWVMVRALQDRVAELKRSEDRFELVVAATDEGIWDWDCATNEVYFSERYRALLGYEPNDHMTARPDSFWDAVHPEDKPNVAHRLQRHLVYREPYDVEFRLKTKDGDIRWFRATAQAVWDGNGNAVRVAGSLSDIHEQRQTQTALRLARERQVLESEQFSQSLLQAQETERQRLANELHDSVGQYLSLISNRARILMASSSLHADLKPQVESVLQCAAEAIAEIRTLVGNLRPMHIEELGLKDAIDGMLGRVGSTGNLQLSWRLDDVNDVLKGTRATHVYRIVQEAVNNIVKHAQARTASVVMERDIHCVRLLIRDDGRGLNQAEGRRGGMGMTSMTERARLLGGQLWVEAGEGGGTTLRVELPISDVSGDIDPAALASG